MKKKVKSRNRGKERGKGKDGTGALFSVYSLLKKKKKKIAAIKFFSLLVFPAMTQTDAMLLSSQSSFTQDVASYKHVYFFFS